MDWSTQMANELKEMMQTGKIEEDLIDEISSIEKQIREGRKLNDFYKGNTPQKLLHILDEINQKVKR